LDHGEFGVTLPTSGVVLKPELDDARPKVGEEQSGVRTFVPWAV